MTPHERFQTICTASSSQTFAAGYRLGKSLVTATVIALHGDLGAGKTTFTQGIARGMGVEVPVTSPTFTLVNEYSTPGGLTLVHVDSYRLGEAIANSALEAETFGLGELLDDEEAVVVIEWAERVAPLLPADHLSVTFCTVPNDPETRQVEWRSYGPIGAGLIAAVLADLP